MTTISKKIFIDTSVLIAFVDRADNNHPKAVKAFEILATQKYHLFTSSQNIADAYAAISREDGTSVALDFLRSVLSSNIEIAFPQKNDYLSIYRMLKQNRERQLTFREVINATQMQKRGIIQILTFTYWHNLFGTHINTIL
jgi:predicted nucleic acid-binding protein